jgi:molecular chaperone DnaK
MKIGVDFGTTYTKIAYPDPENNGNLKLFRYPNPNGKEYIPTALAYHNGHSNKQDIVLGEAARQDNLNQSNMLFYENFKMFFSNKNVNIWKDNSWPEGATPIEIVRYYFRYLIKETKFCFERQMNCTVESMVVSVPEAWQHGPDAENLRSLLVDDLGFPVDYLCSEPVCAGAYYAYRHQQLYHKTTPFTLLVCDMGGGTFDVTFCRVGGPYQVEVLNFDGNGQQGFDLAGLSFDRAAVIRAYSKHHERLLPITDPNFIKLVHSFETEKIKGHSELLGIMELNKTNPRLLLDTKIYTFMQKYTLTLSEIIDLFKPIKEGIVQVLNRGCERAQKAGHVIDQVAIVGGFGQFPLVQQTILEILGITDTDDPRFNQTLNHEDRFYAVAKGAALIANELILPAEYYPHTLGLNCTRLLGGIPQEIFVPLVEAGQTKVGQAMPCYAKEIIVVENRQIEHLPLVIRLHGGDKAIMLSLPELELPELGTYKVGVLIDRFNLGQLIFEPQGAGTKKIYNLGNVNPAEVY